MWTWLFTHYPSYDSVLISIQSWDTKHNSQCSGPEYFQITQQRYVLGIWTFSSILVNLYTTKFIIQQFLIFTLSVFTDHNQISKWKTVLSLNKIKRVFLKIRSVSSVPQKVNFCEISGLRLLWEDVNTLRTTNFFV